MAEIDLATKREGTSLEEFTLPRRGITIGTDPRASFGQTEKEAQRYLHHSTRYKNKWTKEK